MAAAQVWALRPQVPELRESSPKLGLADSPLVLRTFVFPRISSFEEINSNVVFKASWRLGRLREQLYQFQVSPRRPD
jgi:hypothetical protein